MKVSTYIAEQYRAPFDPTDNTVMKINEAAGSFARVNTSVCRFGLIFSVDTVQYDITTFTMRQSWRFSVVYECPESGLRVGVMFI